MLLSVILPYYNSGVWIGKALDSLLAQDIPSSEYEIIVVDDGSEEEPNTLKDYIGRYPQISYHRIGHAGLSPARNYGLSLAQGEWLYLCDSDDFLQPNVLGGIIAAAQERALDMICANAIGLNLGDPVPEAKRHFDSVSAVQSGMEYLVAPPAYFSWGTWSYLVRRSVVESAGLQFPDIFYVEDRLYMLELMPHVRRVAFIDVDLYYYVQHEVSILHSRKKHDGEGYADAMFTYMRRLASVIETLPEQGRLLEHFDWGAFSMLLNVFRYCPVRKTKESIAQLTRIGAYPLTGIQFRDKSQWVKLTSRRWRLLKLMNIPPVWIGLCRVFHLLPFNVRALT